MKIKHLRFKTYAAITVVALFFVTVAFIVNHKSDVLKGSQSYYQHENDYLTSLRMNTKTGEFSVADYTKALKEVQRYRKTHNSRSSLTWQNSGPDNFAGRVRALLKDKNSNYIYLGSPNGGLWRIKEDQEVWQPLDGLAKNLNVSCIHQANNGTFYVGTGEGYYSEDFNMLPGFKARGIFISDNGVDFNPIPSTVPASNAVTGDEWYYINKLATNDTYLFAATNTGLKYSNLSGDEWNYASVNNNPLQGNCNEVVINGNDIIAFVDGLAYASTTGDPNQFVCISTQSGDNNLNMLPQDSIGRMTFAFAPTDANYLYALAIYDTDNPNTKDYDERGALKGVYRCIKNNGNWDNWELVGPGGSFNMFYVFETNGLYSNALYVDPEDATKIYIGGMDLWMGKDQGPNNNIYQWTQLTTYENIFSKAYAPQNHFAYYKSNNNILIACENGVYKYDFSEGKSIPYNLNLNISQFYTVSTDYQNNVYGGSQGIGTIKIDKAQSLSGKTAQNLHNHISITTGNDFTSNKIGGYVHNSMINPIGTFVSINGRADLKDENTQAFADYKGVQSLALYRFDDQVPQNISYWKKGKALICPIEDSASYITPSILWENFDYDFSVDSVTFIADRDYTAGETIIAASKNAKYPINHTLTNALFEGESIRVHDKVASRMFIGVNGSIFMTTEASNFNTNFNVDTPWWTISSSKVNGVTGTPQCLGLSKDANYLYVGTTNGNLYRISNIAYAHDRKTANVAENLYKNTTHTINPYCVVSTSLIKQFENRIITSVSVNPTNPEMVVVTLGNYGYDDYIYISNNALDQNPTFTKVNSFANAPIFTSLFIEGTDVSDNMFMLGCDFGIWKTDDITESTPVWTEEVENLAEVPIFMIKQQNVQTIDDNPIYPPDTIAYISNYRGIYAASFGRGLYECLDYVKAGNAGVGITEMNITDQQLVVYPNPAIDNTTIEINTEVKSPVIVNIYDITGKLVYTNQAFAQNGKVSFKVNTSNFSSGTYIIRTIAENKQQSSKFIVK